MLLFNKIIFHSPVYLSSSSRRIPVLLNYGVVPKKSMKVIPCSFQGRSLHRSTFNSQSNNHNFQNNNNEQSSSLPMIPPETIDNLVKDSVTIRKKSYMPYSNMKNGSSVLGIDGEIYSGCGIENLDHNSSVCAERVAIFGMISKGIQKLKAISIATETGIPPCEDCLTVLSEFATTKDIPIYLVSGCDKNSIKTVTLDSLINKIETINGH